MRPLNHHRNLSRWNVRTSAFLIAAVMALCASPLQAKESSEDFAQKATAAGTFEIDSSRLALSRSKNADVRKFAETMVSDHTSANGKLANTISSSSISQANIIIGEDAPHEKMIEKLTKASDEDFDQAYIEEQRQAHDEAVTLFSDYAKSGDDAGLKKFAAETLPILKQHQQMARELKSSQ